MQEAVMAASSMKQEAAACKQSPLGAAVTVFMSMINIYNPNFFLPRFACHIFTTQI